MNHCHAYFATIILAVQIIGSQAAVLYVDLNSNNPVSPYGDWTTAATTIQDAVDAANSGDQILVTNGLYQTGGRVVTTLNNRVAITKSITVQSVNGPKVTIIQGYQLPGVTNGDGAVRCVYLTNNATLIGFTLTNGATRAASGERTGGGVFCRSSSSVVSNCVLVGNAAATSGGGASSGTLYKCTLIGNTATNGGGASSSTLNDCILTGNKAFLNGGGVYSGTLTNCVLSGNFAGSGGGAASATLNDCTLYGCTLSNNYAATNGGGVSSCTLKDCLLEGNSAKFGGGARRGTLQNCILKNNSAEYGGGLYYGSATNCFFTLNFASISGGAAYGDYSYRTEFLLNCTLVQNSALYTGGGVWGCVLTNSLVYFNTAAMDSNWSASSMDYCCTSPAHWYGTSNIMADPQLASSSHLAATSPCRAAGAIGVTKTLDIDGEPWETPPSIGCDEYRAGSIGDLLSVNIELDYPIVSTGWDPGLRTSINGRVSASRWEFENGTVVSNRPSVAQVWNSPGTYPVILRAYNPTYPDGVSATVTVQVVSRPVHYVSPQSGNKSSAPYTSWATAATNIQNALDAAVLPGALVLVSNGVYSAGGRVVSGALTNRVAIMKPVELRSVNGPGLTVIEGYRVPGTDYSSASVRCVFLMRDAILNGFTLTNGSTTSGSNFWEPDGRGAGVFAASSSIITNCIIVSNTASGGGGGIFGGSVSSCYILNNSSGTGGGCHSSVARNCTFYGNRATDGGGAYDSTLTNCVLANGRAAWGGGIEGGAAYNCLFTNNYAGTEGGGAYNASLINCTIVSNIANVNGYGGGGLSQSIATNCIIYYNTGLINGAGANYRSLGSNNPQNCCTIPLPSGGSGNFTNAPFFSDLVGGNLHLQFNSPCINSGKAISAVGSVDLDGSPRIQGGSVDIGAYELQSPNSILSYFWAQQYGVPTDGFFDFTDSDGDGLNNWQEWMAGTNPTNASSLLKVFISYNTPALKLSWLSVTNRSYRLERATNLTSLQFSTVGSQIIGLNGITSVIDSNALSGGPFFYRVRIE